jgi:hypothetical protein
MLFVHLCASRIMIGIDEVGMARMWDMLPKFDGPLLGLGPLGLLIAAWFQLASLWVISRRYRRVRLKTPEMEIEASTAEEVERLVLAVHALGRERFRQGPMPSPHELRAGEVS